MPKYIYISRVNTPQTRNQGKVEVEDILEPLDGRSRLVGQDLDQVGTSLVSRGLEGVLVELLDAVLDAKIGLRPRERTVNTGCGLGGVATEEVCSARESETAGQSEKRSKTHSACPRQGRFHRSGRLCERHSGQRLR